jgi:hypothetical protein
MIERRLLSVRTKMTDDEVREAFAAIAAKLGGQKVEGVILQEIVTPEGRWLNPDPTPMTRMTRASWPAIHAEPVGDRR